MMGKRRKGWDCQKFGHVEQLQLAVGERREPRCAMCRKVLRSTTPDLVAR